MTASTLLAPQAKIAYEGAMTAIVVEGLSKRFGKITAVAGISFTVARGQTVALLGANGAGKTTTLAMLLGLISPSAGRIEILGHDMARARFAALARMNFASPYVALPARLSVAENLRVYGHLYGVADLSRRIRTLADELHLGDLLDRPAGTLSSGQKARLSLAKALINRPEVLLLDEPTASLDPDTADRTRSWLSAYRAASGCTLLLASHNMAEVERLSDEALILRRGEIVARGSPAALRARYGRETLEGVFLDVARAAG